MNSDREQLLQNFFESIAHLHRSMLANRDTILRAYSLNRPQCELLFLLYHQPSVTIKEIAETMRVTSSAATQLTESLMKSGYITRTHDEHDRRIVHISLSGEGRKKLRSCKQSLVAHLLPQLSHITNEELQTVANIAHRIAEAK